MCNLLFRVEKHSLQSVFIFCNFKHLFADGNPIMASASTEGHIALWDLEKRQLGTALRDAHKGVVCGMKFLASQPLLVTNGPDNSLKVGFIISQAGLFHIYLLRRMYRGIPISRAINFSNLPISQTNVRFHWKFEKMGYHCIYSFQIWIFDQPDGSGRLLRSRSSHSAPPTKIRFYGSRGVDILSAGMF